MLLLLLVLWCHTTSEKEEHTQGMFREDAKPCHIEIAQEGDAKWAQGKVLKGKGTQYLFLVCSIFFSI